MHSKLSCSFEPMLLAQVFTVRKYSRQGSDRRQSVRRAAVAGNSLVIESYLGRLWAWHGPG